MDMTFPKHSILQALSVLVLAWVLVRCQAPVEPEEEEEEEEPIEKTDILTAVTKAKSTVCPPECSCTTEGAVDCAGVDLTEFPSELSENTRQLSLQVSLSLSLSQSGGLRGSVRVFVCVSVGVIDLFLE